MGVGRLVFQHKDKVSTTRMDNIAISPSRFQ